MADEQERQEQQAAQQPDPLQKIQELESRLSEVSKLTETIEELRRGYDGTIQALNAIYGALQSQPYAPPQPPQQPTPQAPQFSLDLEDYDPFDEGHRKKVLNTLKTLAEQYVQLSKQLEEVRKAPQAQGVPQDLMAMVATASSLAASVPLQLQRIYKMDPKFTEEDEKKLLQYASEKRMTDLTAAYKELFADRILERERERIRQELQEQLKKEAQAAAAQGVARPRSSVALGSSVARTPDGLAEEIGRLLNFTVPER
jgi:hypothetical protein